MPQIKTRQSPSPRIPTLRKEETVFSYFARALALSGYTDASEFSDRLLGRPAYTGSAGVLESGLSNFARSMRYFGVRFPRSLLQDHCLAAVGLPFCQQDIYDKKIRSVKSTSHSGKWEYFGMSKTRVKQTPSHCAICTQQDLETLGYSYWRRTPQIVGVKMCPTHRVMLSDDCATCHAEWGPDCPPTNTCAHCGATVVPGDVFDNSSRHKVLLRFAEAVEAIFVGRITGPMTSKTIRGRIKKLFPESDKVLARRLTQFFLDTAGPEYLAELDLGIGATNKFPWPTGLFAECTIFAEARLQILTYAVLSADKPRESLFLKQFPTHPDWHVCADPCGFIPDIFHRRDQLMARRNGVGVTGQLFH